MSFVGVACQNPYVSLRHNFHGSVFEANTITTQVRRRNRLNARRNRFLLNQCLTRIGGFDPRKVSPLPVFRHVRLAYIFHLDPERTDPAVGGGN